MADEKAPTAQDLPGVDDRAIGPLEKMAEQYANSRDERMARGLDEKKLKDKILAEMKELGRTTYKRPGISIEIVTEKEGVKVKVTKPTDDVDEPPF